MDSVFYSRQRIIKNANVSFNSIALQPFFTNRVFQIFDKDNSGSISLQEFIDAIHQFAGQSPEDKIKFLFKVYDIDGKQIRINKSKHFDWFRDWNCDSMSNACSTRECSLLSIARSFFRQNESICTFQYRWWFDSTSWITARNESLHGRKWNAILRRPGKRSFKRIVIFEIKRRCQTRRIEKKSAVSIRYIRMHSIPHHCIDRWLKSMTG